MGGYALERNQSQCALAISREMRLLLPPLRRRPVAGDPGEEKATWLTCFRDTSTLVPLYHASKR